MKNLHIEKIFVNDTNLNHNMQLSITELIRFLQVATFNHSNKILLDHDTMQKESNAFWVITKLKVKLKKQVSSGNYLKVATWTQPLTSSRANRSFKVKQQNTVVATGIAEWCCLDFSTRKVRKLSSIKYPDLEMVENSEPKLCFENLNKQFCEENFVYSRTISLTDIDINKHTNNLKYNLIALDALTLEEFDQMLIDEYEIHFINETKLYDKIDVFKIKEKNMYYIEGRNSNNTVFRVGIKFKKMK